MLATFIISVLVLAALTELQVDELIRILKTLLEAMGSGVQAVWNLLSPILLAYLAFKQAQNRKALDNNTAVSEKAFKEANGINEKIAASTKMVEHAVTSLGVKPAFNEEAALGRASLDSNTAALDNNTAESLRANQGAAEVVHVHVDNDAPRRYP